MRIAVISAGQSTRKHLRVTDLDSYDEVIGVNRAGWVYPVTMLAYLDPIMWRQWPDGIAFPGVILTGGKVKRPDGFKGRVIVPPVYNRKSADLPTDLMREHAINHCNYTFPCALSVAAMLTAEGGEVDVYGMDFTNDKDVGDGYGMRSVSRWKRELPWIKHLWRPHWRALCDAPEAVVRWFEGSGSEAEAWEALEASHR